MSTADDFYAAERLAATMAHLSGGRISVDDLRARMAPSPTERLTASEIIALVPPLSGSHTVTTTMRGRGWGPPKPREPINWAEAGWPRGPDGRFIVVQRADEDDDFDD
jgi:hypothetical protein